MTNENKYNLTIVVALVFCFLFFFSLNPFAWLMFGLVMLGTHLVASRVFKQGKYKQKQGKLEIDRLCYKMQMLEEPDQELIYLGKIIHLNRKSQYDPRGLAQITAEGEFNIAYAEASSLMEMAKDGEFEYVKSKIEHALK